MAEFVIERLTGNLVRNLASECGLDLAGVASPARVPDFDRYRSWVDRGLAGEMTYLTDRRADVRKDPAQLLPGVKSIICVGSLYNGPVPVSTEFSDPERGWIARYAWGDDYHDVLRAKLEELADKLLKYEDFKWRTCVDSAPFWNVH